jgi:hypothetical protein
VPALGLRVQGTLTWHFADRVEVFEAGDAYFVPPGHTPVAGEGSEFLQFSPTEELRVSEAAIMKNMQAMPDA